MKYFYGKNQMKSYFEGWYFKHRKEEEAISIIAAYHIDEQGVKKASIQVITADKAYTVWYPGSVFYAEEGRLFVRIGKNIFYDQGCRLDINTYDLRLKGDLRYGVFHRLAYDIMGPFALVPQMQCSHSVVSMGHRLSGSLTLNGDYMDFKGGYGYIEGDRGSSFPKSYVWLQCEELELCGLSLMVSIADIPTAWGSFTGCICAIRYHKSQYRLATYRNVKVRRNDRKVIWLCQGEYTLLIQMEKEKGLALRAPSQGSMNRIIREQLMGTARIRLYEGKELIFDVSSNHVSVEREG